MLPVVQQQAVRERIAGHGGLHIGHAVAVGVLQQGDVARLAYTSPLGAACSQRTLPRPLAKTEISKPGGSLICCSRALEKGTEAAWKTATTGALAAPVAGDCARAEAAAPVASRAMAHGAMR